MVDNGCFLHKSHNGILFDMHCNEGYWLYCGPPDNASHHNNQGYTLVVYYKSKARAKESI
jgi:hypothetical protein